MKKLLATILSLGMCFTLGFGATACDETPPENPAPDAGGMTEETWEDMLETEIYDNVTFSMEGLFDGESMPFYALAKLDGQICAFTEEGETEIYDAEYTASVRSVYLNTTLAVLNNYDNFTYVAETQKYVSSNDITYEVEIVGYQDATILVRNAVLTLTEDKKVGTLSCWMKQTYTSDDGYSGVNELTVTFTFSDYGTTVVETA